MSLKCSYCGYDIIGRRSDAKYCSKKCCSSMEKRRYKEKRNLSKKPQRGPNTGRSKSPEYHKLKQREYAENRRKETGFKGKYAKARSLGFRSMFEVSIAEALDKEELEYEYESLSIPYSLQLTYIPDIVLPNGILIELKGRLTEQDRRKMLAVKKDNPDKDIRFVFQRANVKLTKAKKGKTYWQWAEANGFQWAEGHIPIEWFNEEI